MMRAFRALLWLYPASFRNEYGGELCAIFARRRRGATTGGRVLVWLEAVADVMVNAPRVHGDLLTQDLRYCVRALRRKPAFASTAILVAALGIGASTAAFSVTDHVLIRPLPFREPDRLVKLYQDQSYRGYARMELSPANFRDWRRMATGFETMGGYTDIAANLVGEGEPERVDTARVTAEVLPILGVAPALGRLFAPEDDRDGAGGTVILSHRLWQERFGASGSVLGRKIILDDEPFEVIGVMPQGFYFPWRDTQLWTAMRFGPSDFEDRANWYINVIARLRDGVSVEAARAQLQLVAAQLAHQYPNENARNGATVIDLRSEISRQSRMLLFALFGAATCVLLIACTNLGNLLLARAVARRREVAVRAALGAGTERLLRQMLTESLLLAGTGGALGIALAIVAMPLAARLVPNSLPIAEMPDFDTRMLAFAAVATFITGIGFGIIPAVRGARVDASALADGARTGHGRRTERLRAMLVVTEVTASVVLLVSAGLLVRALWTVQQVNPGFNPDDVLTARTALPLPKYAVTDARARFYDRVLSELRGLPGVAHAAYISFVPMGPMRGGIWPITSDGRRESEINAPTASLRLVTPGFFQALRIPLLAGRDVNDRDTSRAPAVAVVSRSFARQYWPGQQPLGQRFFIAFEQRTVVGVVGDVRVRGLERPSEPQVYLPFQQVPDNGLVGYMPRDLVVRSTMPLATLVPALRAIVAGADPRLPVSDIQTMRDLLDAETGSRTAQLRVLGAFAGVALLLAGIGLHGLLTFMVSQQFREIGVRIALGAGSRHIVAMVVRQGLVLAAAGAAIGIAVAYAAGRAMQSILAGISPADTLAYGASVALVLGAALTATLVPAVRATRIDPLSAIRTD